MRPEYITKDDAKRSRSAYVVQCTIEYFISILVADAFLAKLLKSIGLSDSLIGVISSLISVTFLIQLLSIVLMRHMKNVKLNVIIYDMLSMIFFFCTYFIPFLKADENVKTILVFICIIGGFFCKYLVLNVYYSWANSYVHPLKRGSFGATKEMISLASGIAFTLGVGFVVDRYEANGNLQGSFLFIAIVMIVLTAGNLISLLFIKNANQEDTVRQQKTVREVMANTFGNRAFVYLLIVSCIWSIACYTTTGFLGTFKTEDLLFTVGTVQLINMAGSLGRFLLSKPFGAYSDKTSYAKGYCLALCVAAAAFLCVTFTGSSTRFLIIGYTVLYNTSMAGINANSYNMTYSYVPLDCFVQAQAIKSSISGLLGFGASVLAGQVLKSIQASGNIVLGIPMYGQQLLGTVSFILTLTAIILTKVLLEKQKVMKQ